MLPALRLFIIFSGVSNLRINNQMIDIQRMKTIIAMIASPAPARSS